MMFYYPMVYIIIYHYVRCHVPLSPRPLPACAGRGGWSGCQVSRVRWQVAEDGGRKTVRQYVTAVR